MLFAMGSSLGTSARSHLAIRVVLALLIGFVFEGPATGQESTPEPPAAPASVEHYRVGPGDLLAISVFGIPDFDHSGRVSNSGRMHVPHIGVIHVADMTVPQLREQLAAKLRTSGLVREPWVDIRVAQYRATPVYILGEVIMPGQYIMKEQMRLVDLITLAQGVNAASSPVGYLYRRRTMPPGSQVATGDRPPDNVGTVIDDAIEIDLLGLLNGTKHEDNLVLQAGDVLYVPVRTPEYFFVAGDVANPGVFELLREQPILLTQALFKAGGPLRTARASRGQVLRARADGTREALRVDLKAILQGRRPDVPIQANDIVFIPGSSAKTVGYGLLRLVPGIVTRTIF